jgi:hypothetical protein
MSLNLDAGAFVVTGTISTPSAGAKSTLVYTAPCDLDIAGVQLYAGTVSAGASTVNIKVTPPTAAPLYARTYNYNYATAKNVQVVSVATDGSVLTFTTATAHSLSTGDVVSVTGSTLPAWNLKDAVVASATSGTTTFTVAYPEVTGSDTHVTGISGIVSGNSVAQVIIGTDKVTFTTDNLHGLKTGDKVTVTGVGGVSAANVTASAVTVTGSKSFSVSVPGITGSVTAAAVTIKATVVSNSTNPIVVTKGQVVNAVQLVTDDVDYNRASNYAQGTAYYAYISDLVLPASARGAQFGAATNLGNADGRVSGRISAGSLVELEVQVRGTTTTSLADLAFGVEFKKK